MTRRLIAHLLVGTIAVVAIEYPSAAGAQPAVVASRAAGVAATWSKGGTIDPLAGAPTAVSCPRRGSAPQWTRMGPSSSTTARRGRYPKVSTPAEADSRLFPARR